MMPDDTASFFHPTDTKERTTLALPTSAGRRMLSALSTHVGAAPASTKKASAPIKAREAPEVCEQALNTPHLWASNFPQFVVAHGRGGDAVVADAGSPWRDGAARWSILGSS